jgi:predicted house-cleaning noncanonical NTP pyrophosphatase (MazG superfamily)
MKYGLLKDDDPLQKNEITLDDRTYLEALKTKMCDLTAEYICEGDMEKIYEIHSVMEEIAKLDGINHSEFRALCAKRREYGKRRYKERASDTVPRDNKGVLE